MRSAAPDKLFALGGGVAGKATPAGGWTQRAPMPAVRGEVAAGPRNEEYEPATDRWRERAPVPQARDHLGVAAHNGKIYTFGGFTLAPMKAPRAAVGVTVLAGKIHVIGGRGLDGVTVATHEVYESREREMERGGAIAEGARPYGGGCRRGKNLRVFATARWCRARRSQSGGSGKGERQACSRRTHRKTS
ncbi:MAG TPA: hypothetical protein VKB89_33535 [Xanthobacteraceae bacterium]|nr:hypothetical protein [Xanthobacteraceae bacterium]